MLVVNATTLVKSAQSRCPRKAGNIIFSPAWIYIHHTEAQHRQHWELYIKKKIPLKHILLQLKCIYIIFTVFCHCHYANSLLLLLSLSSWFYASVPPVNLQLSLLCILLEAAFMVRQQNIQEQAQVFQDALSPTLKKEVSSVFQLGYGTRKTSIQTPRMQHQQHQWGHRDYGLPGRMHCVLCRGWFELCGCFSRETTVYM